MCGFSRGGRCAGTRGHAASEGLFLLSWTRQQGPGLFSPLLAGRQPHGPLSKVLLKFQDACDSKTLEDTRLWGAKISILKVAECCTVRDAKPPAALEVDSLSRPSVLEQDACDGPGPFQDTLFPSPPHHLLPHLLPSFATKTWEKGPGALDAEGGAWREAGPRGPEVGPGTSWGAHSGLTFRSLCTMFFW